MKKYTKPFEQVLKEEILVPLKMHNTGMLHHNDIMQNIDDGYAADESDAFSLHTLPILILTILFCRSNVFHAERFTNI